MLHFLLGSKCICIGLCSLNAWGRSLTVFLFLLVWSITISALLSFNYRSPFVLRVTHSVWYLVWPTSLLVYLVLSLPHLKSSSHVLISRPHPTSSPRSYLQFSSPLPEYTCDLHFRRSSSQSPTMAPTLTQLNGRPNTSLQGQRDGEPISEWTIASGILGACVFMLIIWYFVHRRKKQNRIALLK